MSIPFNRNYLAVVLMITFSSVQSVQALTIRNDYTDTNLESIQEEMIDFDTGSKSAVSVTIGGDQTESVILDKGINLDDEAGSATIDMTMNADSVEISGGYGINYGTSTIVVGGNNPGENHILNIFSDSLTVKSTTALNSFDRLTARSALSVNAKSTVNLGSSEQRISSVSLSAETTEGGTNAVYIGDGSTANIYANSVEITTKSSGSTSAGLYVTGGGEVNIDALNNITITNQNGYGIDSYGNGWINLSAKGDVDINANKTSKAISLRTVTYNKDQAGISVQGKNIFLTGRVENSGSSSESNSLTVNLSAEDTVSIETDNSNYGAVYLNYRRNLDLSGNSVYISNKSSDGVLKGLGFHLDGSGTSNPTVDASFNQIMSIEAETGIYMETAKAQFNAQGKDATQSQLLINASLAGISAKNNDSENMIENTSVAINLNRDAEITDPWYGPTGSNGMAGIYNASSTKTTLQNGQFLSVEITATDKLEGKKVSGLLSDASTKSGLLLVQNYDLVSLDLTDVDKSANVYGIRAVSSNVELKDIGTFETKVNSGYGIYASSYTSSNSSDQYAKGRIDIDADNVDIEAGNATAFYASDQGSIALKANDQLIVNSEKNFIKSEGEGSSVVIDASNAIAQINGNISASTKGQASLSFQNGSYEGNVTSTTGGQTSLSFQNGTFTGKTTNYLNSIISSLVGEINLTLGSPETKNSSNGKAQWNVTGNSTLTNLDMYGGTLNLAWADPQDSDRVYKKVQMKQLGSAQSSFGDIYLNIDLGNEQSGDLDFIEADRVNGTYVGYVHFDNPGDLSDKLYTEHYLIRQEDGSMTINNPSGFKYLTGDGMLSSWTWKFLPDNDKGNIDKSDQDQLWALDNTSNGEAGDWLLVRVPSSETSSTPHEVNDNLAIGTSTGQALAYMADMEDLRKRIGEVRYGAQDGLWAKAFAKQDRVNGNQSRGFKQEAYGINVGFDKLVGTTETSSWLIGAAFRYGTSDQSGLGIAGGANGEMEEYSVKAYATWMHESGSYADIVLQAGRYEQELSGLSNTSLKKVKADYHTWGYGVSFETGHMFSFNNQGGDDRINYSHWLIEPQIELSYFRAQGADYLTSSNMKVEQGDADFLTGRAGLVIGKKFNYGTLDDLDRRYFQIGLIGGVKHEFLGGDQTIRYTGVDNVKQSIKADDFAGTRAYYGINVDWQLSQNLRLFGELSREKGDGYSKDYDISLGLKYNF